MFWSALQIILLIYLGVMALVYFKQSSLVFLPEMDRGFRASPADIGLPFTPKEIFDKIEEVAGHVNHRPRHTAVAAKL